MKKETGIAISLGIIFGIIIAFSILLYTRGNPGKKTNVLSPQISPTIVVTTIREIPLTITNPLDLTIVRDQTIDIEGKANAGNLAVIQSQYFEKVEKLKQNVFNIKFPMTLGENKIKVTIYSKTGVETKTITIYYLKND
jgi:hypothetical protein